MGGGEAKESFEDPCFPSPPSTPSIGASPVRPLRPPRLSQLQMDPVLLSVPCVLELVDLSDIEADAWFDSDVVAVAGTIRSRRRRSGGYDDGVFRHHPEAGRYWERVMRPCRNRLAPSRRRWIVFHERRRHGFIRDCRRRRNRFTSEGCRNAECHRCCSDRSE